MSDSPALDRGRAYGRVARRRVALAGATALALVLGHVSRAAATTYYVRATGDDGNDGLSPATAFASIRPAARLLREPGDRLIVGPGTYHEGNIAPFGNGTPEAPIVLHADPTGVLTDDSAGPVTILPNNAPNETTGIIVYGRHDIVIEGFTAVGAKDAGIQVRGRRRTGADSTRVAILDNVVRASRNGIHVIAIGEVVVTGNQLTGSGLVLASGPTGRLQPLVSHNTIAQSRFGVAVSGAVGGTISENQLRSNGKDLSIFADGMRIVANHSVGSARGGRISGADLEITDNVLEGSVFIDPQMTVVFSRNTIGRSVHLGGSPTQALVSENHLQYLFVAGGGQLQLAHNEGTTLQAGGTEAIVASDNRFMRQMKMLATSSVDARRNQATNLDARGVTALIQDNVLSGRVGIAAETATLSGNTAAMLWVRRPILRYPKPSGPARGPYLAEGNVVHGVLSLGESASAVAQDNVVDGVLKARARDQLTVTRNRTGGIACALSAPDSQLILTENSARQGSGPALIVTGAGNALIERNSAASSADAGLAVRRTNRLTIADNEIIANPDGGITIRNPLAADCNGDVEVTITDLMTAVGVALGLRPTPDCEAADRDRDGAVEINELTLGVGAALARPDAAAGAIEIRGNRVERNGRFGINVVAAGPVLAIGNHVVRNGGAPLRLRGRGLPNEIRITDNFLGLGGAEGLVLEGADGARVRNNIVFGNREAGILVRDASSGVAIVNNLVYDNGKHGIAVGLGSPQRATGATVMNNTLYRNHAWGIAIGGPGTPSAATMVRNNIVFGNLQGGIAAAPQSLAGLTIEFNLNDGGYSEGVPPAATDLVADPQFVAPAGADGVLGGDGFVDDDFRLQATSPAIDAGSATALALSITGSAVVGMAGDTGVVDLGFHYGADDR